MDSSRRAVESYWRSRMIDAATSDEDKIAPVYKLEEICDLLRSSHVSIIKEVSEFILKRLDHKSPIVKQKALRLIKYAVGKSGTEFRREIQRHSVAVRQLLHHRGHPDPLKGEALNKAVRETAQEAISAIFSEQQDEKVSAAENLNRRIEGFGNTNFKMPSEEKNSFLSEVVDIGSATIKQGLNSFAQGQSNVKNENGSYKSPNLRRSLTLENDTSSNYNSAEVRRGSQNSSGSWNPDMTVGMTEKNNEGSTSRTGSRSREERLLETVVTSGGVRLQPTRDAIQVFLRESVKLDSLALSHALEGKLESPQWQVRLKAVCVLDAIVRKRDEDRFSIISSYFEDNKDVVIRCSESPQASLREKANKVLSLLGGRLEDSTLSDLGRSVKAERTTVVEMPDLIDTSGPDDATHGTNDSEILSNLTVHPTPLVDDLFGDGLNNVMSTTVVEMPDLIDTSGPDDATHGTNDSEILGNLTVHPTPLVDDLFGDGLNNVMSTSEQKTNEDPFADVSFHTSEVVRESTNDIFTGMSVSSNDTSNGNHVATSKNEPASFDFFGFECEVGQEYNKNAVNDLMAGLSIEKNAFTNKQKTDGPPSLLESIYSDLKGNSVQQIPTDALNQLTGSQTPGLNANVMPSFSMPYGLAPGMMFNSAQSSQQFNYTSMGNILSQQQFLAAMSNLQQYAALNSANSTHVSVTTGGGSTTSPIPDIFQAGFPSQATTSTLNMSRKPDTKAFDFISDHIAAARDPKRMF